VGSDILFTNMLPLLVDVEIGTLYYSPTEAGLTLVCLCFSRSPETRIPSTDRGWPQRKWRCFPSTLRVCPFNVL